MTDARKQVVALAMALQIWFFAGDAQARLIAHWKLDETSGITARDTTGNGNEAKLAGGVSFGEASVAGAVGGALQLNGAGGRVAAETLTVPTNAFTIAFWLNPDFNMNVGGGRIYLMFWGGPQRPQGDKPYLVINKTGDGKMRYYVGVGDSQYYLETSTSLWKGGKWYHLAVTFDNTNARIYVDSVLENTGNHRGTHYASRRVYIGAKDTGGISFKGKIDDIRIYDHALTENEVKELTGSDPALQNLLLVALQAEAMIKTAPEQAVAFIENAIAESQRWERADPNRHSSAQKGLSFDLHFLSAKAREAARYTKEQVDSAYKQAFKLGTPSVSTSLSVLLWLHQSGRTEEYDAVLSLLNNSKEDRLEEVAAKAEKAILKDKPREAIVFLEDRLAAYAHWRQKNSQIDTSFDSLPGIYFRMAKAKQAVGAPKNEIAEAYFKTLTVPGRKYPHEQTPALLWLLENNCSNERTAAVKSLAQSDVAAGVSEAVVRQVCRHMESKNDSATFELFLDALFSDPQHAFKWALFVESCIGSRTSRWAKAYLEYLAVMPRQKLGWDWAAEKYAAANKFQKAAELYRNAAETSKNPASREIFEFQARRCLFMDGDYRQLIPRLESYIAKDSSADRSLINMAMLMKGQAQIQIGEPDKAEDMFAAVLNSRPPAEEAAQAALLMGYCCLLQRKAEKATEAFNLVLKNYPESSFAGKARLCLGRMQKTKQ